MEIFLIDVLAEFGKGRTGFLRLGGMETIGWLLEKIFILRGNITTKHGIGLKFFSNYSYDPQGRGCGMPGINSLKLQIRDIYENQIAVYYVVYTDVRPVPFTPQNPETINQAILDEYNLVEKYKMYRTEPNSLKNLLIGMVKRNTELLEQSQHIDDNLRDDIEFATDETTAAVLFGERRN